MSLVTLTKLLQGRYKTVGQYHTEDCMVQTLEQVRRSYAKLNIKPDLDFFLREAPKVLPLEQRALLRECFPSLDLTFLKSLKKDRLPAFAAFTVHTHPNAHRNVTSSRCDISYHKNRSGIEITSVKVNNHLMRNFNFEAMLATALALKPLPPVEEVSGNVTVRHDFPLLIPQEERERLVRTVNVGFKVTLITEANEWEIDSHHVSTPVPRDPLIVISVPRVVTKENFVARPSNNVEIHDDYLAGFFDLTTREEYAKREFAG